jgi:hypothetical protein
MAQKPWEKDRQTLEWFKAAAEQVRRESDRNPGIGIPVDPDVAEFMGCFEDSALTEDDWFLNEAEAQCLAGLEAKVQAEADEKASGKKDG